MSDTHNTTSEAPEAPVYLSDTEIVILNAARSILKELEVKIQANYTYSGGFAAARCTAGAEGIFHALVAVSVYLEQEMSSDQLHGPGSTVAGGTL